MMMSVYDAALLCIVDQEHNLPQCQGRCCLCGHLGQVDRLNIGPT